MKIWNKNTQIRCDSVTCLLALHNCDTLKNQCMSQSRTWICEIHLNRLHQEYQVVSEVVKQPALCTEHLSIFLEQSVDNLCLKAKSEIRNGMCPIQYVFLRLIRTEYVSNVHGNRQSYTNARNRDSVTESSVPHCHYTNIVFSLQTRRIISC